ncbi:unnamed protein product [Phytophthora fragariaefolia]|uniref:Unnamed protein product n=1 Tax=Phytophthora fragariaefolia TaxID=1490495 RepID=A0A9W6XYM2_9STRA|nr:unnamed protein product [Phytophthora fragariaefolia]
MAKQNARTSALSASTDVTDEPPGTSERPQRPPSAASSAVTSSRRQTNIIEAPSPSGEGAEGLLITDTTVRSVSSAVTPSTGMLGIAAAEHTAFGLTRLSASQAPPGRRNPRQIAPTRPPQPPTVVEDAVQLPHSFVTELRAPLPTMPMQTPGWTSTTKNQSLSASIESRVGRSNSELLERIDDVLSSTSDSESAPPISVEPSSTTATTENVASVERFAERLAHSDDALTHDQIKAGAVNANTVFWREVGVEYRTNKRDYNNLLEAAVSDPRFSGINPSYIVQHDDGRLYDMWKKGNSSFVKANAKFYVSGQNSEDFYEFCDGNLDAAYLEICTRVKPELAAFVKGGIHPEDEIDSMNLTGFHSDVPANKSAKWQD